MTDDFNVLSLVSEEAAKPIGLYRPAFKALRQVSKEPLANQVDPRLSCDCFRRIKRMRRAISSNSWPI